MHLIKSITFTYDFFSLVFFVIWVWYCCGIIYEISSRFNRDFVTQVFHQKIFSTENFFLLLVRFSFIYFYAHFQTFNHFHKITCMCACVDFIWCVAFRLLGCRREEKMVMVAKINNTTKTFLLQSWCMVGVAFCRRNNIWLLQTVCLWCVNIWCAFPLILRFDPIRFHLLFQKANKAKILCCFIKCILFHVCVCCSPKTENQKSDHCFNRTQ